MLQLPAICNVYRESSAFIWPIHADLYRATLQETVQTIPSLVKRLKTNSIDSSKSFATTAEASIIMQRTVQPAILFATTARSTAILLVNVLQLLCLFNPTLLSTRTDLSKHVTTVASLATLLATAILPREKEMRRRMRLTMRPIKRKTRTRRKKLLIQSYLAQRLNLNKIILQLKIAFCNK